MEQRKVDISKHILVPSFSKLTLEEVKELLDKFNISLIQLPSVLATDPMVRTVGVKANDIIKIERKTSTGKSFYFRKVVE